MAPLVLIMILMMPLMCLRLTTVIGRNYNGSPILAVILGERWRSLMEKLPLAHLKMMGAAQPFISGAISKTINIPVDFDFDDYRSVYEQAYRLGLKGCTTYRPNPVTGAVLESVADDKQAEPACDAAPDSHCCGLDRSDD